MAKKKQPKQPEVIKQEEQTNEILVGNVSALDVVADYDAKIEELIQEIAKLKEQQRVIVKFKRLHKDAKVPTYITEDSAGLDITAISMEYDAKNRCMIYHTGLAVQLPKGYVGLLFPKSGIYKTTLNLRNCVGILDGDYTGEVKAYFKDDIEYGSRFLLKLRIWFNRLLKKLNIPQPLRSKIRRYEIGDKVIQMIVLPFPKVNFLKVEELDKTERGTKGFGEMTEIKK